MDEALAGGWHMTLISVIVPTVPGREVDLNRCLEGYRNRTVNEVEIIVEYDWPSCGLAWQAGLADVHGEYIHLTADDIEPLQGWDVPAVEACDQGFLPAPQVCDPGGNPQSHPQTGIRSPDWTPVHMSALPFSSAKQMEKIVPLLTCQYFIDDFFSWRGLQAGWPSRLRAGYAFTHYWSQVKRGAGMPEVDRMSHDEHLYYQARVMVELGQWTQPWPEAGI
jgi:hypothetical protein